MTAHHTGYRIQVVLSIVNTQFTTNRDSIFQMIYVGSEMSPSQGHNAIPEPAPDVFPHLLVS